MFLVIGDKQYERLTKALSAIIFRIEYARLTWERSRRELQKLDRKNIIRDLVLATSFIVECNGIAI